MQPSNDIRRLIEILAALRTPKTGCPWDLQQTHETLAPYAIEEAYEVVDAIERGDREDLREELGDLLLQVVFHARIAEEAGSFGFGDIVEGVTSKMLRRHPHVFSDAVAAPGPKSGVDKIWQAMHERRVARLGLSGPTEEHGLLAAMAAAEDKASFSNATWEAIKADERKAKAGKGNGDSAATPASVLGNVPSALPGLIRALKLQRKASSVGFDWADARKVLTKIREEIDEIEDAMGQAESDARADEVEAEIGDLLFAVANLARHAGVDPETALRATNRKFERRFSFIEEKLSARGSSPKAATLEEMDALWNEAKTTGL